MIHYVHHTTGRIRLRSQRFKSRHAARRAVQAVEAMPGVDSVEGNARTGSLLVQFDPDQVSAVALLYRLEQAGYPMAVLPAARSAGAKPRGALTAVGRKVGRSLVETLVERSAVALIAALV